MNFTEWAFHHSKIFGLTEAETRTLLSWEEIFFDYLPDELTRATTELARTPGAFAEDRFAGKMAMHLAAIQRRVKDFRAIAYRKRVDETRLDQGTCLICSGTGRVIVPHAKGISGGRWVPIKTARGGACYYTMAVLCHCGLGRWIEGQGDPEKREWRLEEYAAFNPGWPGQMLSRDQEQRAAAKASAGSAGFDAALTEVLGRLRA